MVAQASRACDGPMMKMQVENFGAFGNRVLLNHFGIDWPRHRFTTTARNACCGAVPALGSPADLRPMPIEIVSFAEYDVLQPVQVKGALVYRSGYHAGQPRTWGLLCAMPLVTQAIDRSLCAEFQLLSSVGELLDRSATILSPRGRCDFRSRCVGSLQVHVTFPPCVSCISVFSQFQALWPQCATSVSFDGELRGGVWMKF